MYRNTNFAGNPAMLLTRIGAQLALIILLINSVATIVNGDEGSTSHSNDEIAVLISDLGNSRFSVREEATRRLIELADVDVVPLLAANISAKNTEANWRILDILAAYAQSGDDELATAALATVKRLTQSPWRTVAQRASASYLTLVTARRERVVENLRVLGARVSTKNGEPDSVHIGTEWKGGNAGLIHLQTANQIRRLNLSQSTVSDAGLIHVASLTELQTLHLGDSQIRGSGLTHLGQLPVLTFLSLKSLRLTPDSIEHIAKLKQLKQLGLDDTNITDDQIAALKGLDNLETIWLNRTNISDEGLAHLTQHERLGKVMLTATRLKGPGIAELAKLPALSYVSFQHASINNDAAPHIAKLTNISVLGLDNTEIGDSVVQAISSLANLRVLWLSSTPVTDESVPFLCKMSQLEKLYIRGTKITESGAREIQKALPRCEVTY